MGAKIEKNIPVSAITGRLLSFTPEIGDMICRGIIEGVPMSRICTGKDGLPPDPSTVYYWLAMALRENAVPELIEFRRSYYAARELMPDALIGQCLDIADETENDYKEKIDRNGNPFQAVNQEAIFRSKVRLDCRFRLAGLLSSRYRETKGLDITTNGESLNRPSEEQLAVAHKRLVIELMRMQGGQAPALPSRDPVDAEFTMADEEGTPLEEFSNGE